MEHLNSERDAKAVSIEEFYQLKPAPIWKYFSVDNFAFWMSCAYLFFEYVRPQAIWPVLDLYSSWAQTFVVLSFVGWLLDSNKEFVWTKISTGIAAFLVLIILSCTNAYWPQIAWNNFMNFFNWAVIFFVLTQIITNRRRFFIFLLIFFLASFKLSFYGARTFAMRGFSFTSWGLAGPEGYFQNPGELAIQMVVFAPMALFFTFGVRPYLKKWKAYLLYLMPITAVLTIIGTNTRGGQIALLAVLVAMIAMSKHRLKMFIAVAIIGLIGFQLLPPEQKARFETMGDDATSQQRLLYWQHGWQMIKDHPWLGVGFFNFIPYYKQYHSDDIILPHHARLGIVELPHNIIIQVGTDTGFSGTVVFLGLITFAFLHTRKIGKAAKSDGDLFLENITKGMNLALIGFFVAGQFVTVAYYPFLWIHLLFVTAMDTFWKKEKAHGTNSLYRIKSLQGSASIHR